jgi:hypothetical protein
MKELIYKSCNKHKRLTADTPISWPTICERVRKYQFDQNQKSLTVSVLVNAEEFGLRKKKNIRNCEK